MSDKLIQWPRAKYWDSPINPWIGCQPVSPACDNCWAHAWAKRFNQPFTPHESEMKSIPKSGVIFVGNLTDCFGGWISNPANIIRRFIDWRSDATYLWLTKRVGNMCDALEEIEGLTTFQHYFGFTAENQEWYDRRFSEFKKIPTRFKGWLSAEPLLGPIDLGLNHVYPPEAAPFSWVVVGSESGPNRRPCRIEWVESIVEQCRAAYVPVFVKQLDIGGKCVTDINKFPTHLRIRQVPWAKEGASND